MWASMTKAFKRVTYGNNVFEIKKEIKSWYAGYPSPVKKMFPWGRLGDCSSILTLYKSPNESIKL